jgi:hypothetical protein
MSKYSVLCIGCETNFELNCKNCKHNQFIDSSKDPSKKSLKCTNCGTSVSKIKHQCTAWFSDPKPTTTDIKHSPNNFTNLSKSSTTQENISRKNAENRVNDYAKKAKERSNAEKLSKEAERLRKFHEIKAENRGKEAAKKAKERSNAEKIKVEERRIAEKIKAEEGRIAENLKKRVANKAEELKQSDPIYVLNRQIDDIKKTQEKILNDIESNGCLLFLLSNNELHDYASNTGIELNKDQSHYELMYQIEIAEGTLDTSQGKWNFRSMDEVIVKRFRKIYKNKVKYVESANLQLNHLKSRLDEANRIKQKHEEKNLQESIHKYKIELELNEKRITEKEKVEERRIAENLRKEAASKAKENLKKRFF